MKENFHSYEDIIHMSRPVSRTHPPMPMENRAAQFAPFAALTGYEDCIKETARHTDHKVELEENKRELLDQKFLYLSAHLKERPEIEFLCFVPDAKKEGGAYETIVGIVRKIDFFTKCMILEDNRRIKIDSIIEMKGTLFVQEYE